jgi:hypothetical protein
MVQTAYLGLIGSTARACPTAVTPPSYTSVVALCTPLTALPMWTNILSLQGQMRAVHQTNIIVITYMSLHTIHRAKAGLTGDT